MSDYGSERRIEPGQPIGKSLSHRTVNTMIELVRGQRLQRLGRQGGDGFDSPIGPGLEVFVQNLTGAFQPPGAILSVEQGTPLDPEGDPGEFVRRPCFAGAVPSSPSDVVCVLRDGAADGAVSLAVLRGLAVVALDVTDASHGFAVPIDGDSSQMQSAGSGHPILWTATGGTGAQAAVVLLEKSGGSATITLEERHSDGTLVYTVDTSVVRVDDTTGLGVTSLHTIFLNAASATFPGAVTVTTQSFAGVKTFVDLVRMRGGSLRLEDPSGVEAAEVRWAAGSPGSVTLAVPYYAGGELTQTMTAASVTWKFVNGAISTQPQLQVIDGTGTLRTGGTATVSGLLFSSGLYISGSFSGSGVAIGSAVTGSTPFGVLYADGSGNLANVAPSAAGQVLVSGSIGWATISTGLSLSGGNLTVAYGTSGTTACVGNDSRLSDSRAPSGAAGGDLSGTYPNPGVARIGGVAVTVDTDTTLAADSNALLPTQHAVKVYVDAKVTALLRFKGSTDCSANPNYPAAVKGDAYVVSVAGKIGGASGTAVDVGDWYVAEADNAGGTEAAVGASWGHLEHNLVGALLAANNLSDLASAATARSNLGLGTAALKNTGTSGNNVPLLDGVNDWTANANVFGGGSLGLANAAYTGSNALFLLGSTISGGNKALTFATGNANRTITFGGDLTVSAAASVSGTHTGTSSGTNTGDQSVASLGLSGLLVDLWRNFR